MPRKSTDSVASLDADSKADDASVNTRASRGSKADAGSKADVDSKASAGDETRASRGSKSCARADKDRGSLAERKEKEYVDPTLAKGAPSPTSSSIAPLISRSSKPWYGYLLASEISEKCDGGSDEGSEDHPQVRHYWP